MVWIVNHYATFPSKDGQGGRHYSMARHLAANGWKAIVIAAGTSHPSGERRVRGWRPKIRGEERGVEFVWMNVPGYHGNGLLRVLNMLCFTVLTLLPGMLNRLDRPNIVIGSTVHPFAAWAGLRLARRTGAKFVYEIRDIWPESLVELGHWKRDGRATKVLAALSGVLIRNASMVLSPLPHVDRYLAARGFRETRFLWVANGSDRKESLPDVSQPDSECFVIMYLGAHGNANALDLVIDAFQEFCAANPDVEAKLRFVGDGPLKPVLVEYADAKGLGDRVEFLPKVPREQVFEVASGANCLVAAMYKNAIYEYGVGLNKIADYMMCGRPVVFASPSVDENPVSKAGAGIVVEAGDRVALAGAMGAMYRTSVEQRETMAVNGQRHVLDCYTYDVLSAQLVSGLDSVLE